MGMITATALLGMQSEYALYSKHEGKPVVSRDEALHLYERVSFIGSTLPDGSIADPWREVQEGMEVLQPAPGSTQAWALVRDRASRVRWFYQKRQGGTTDRTELWRVIDDPSRPLAQRHEMLLRDIRRLTFTCRTEGALQMNVLLAEADREYALLTTVRLRNLAAAEELW